MLTGKPSRRQGKGRKSKVFWRSQTTVIHLGLLLCLLFYRLKQPCVYKYYRKHNQGPNFVSNESHWFNMGTQNSSRSTSCDAVTALPVSLFNECNSCFNWFFSHRRNVPSSFGGTPTPPLPPSHPPVIAKTMTGTPCLQPLSL